MAANGREDLPSWVVAQDEDGNEDRQDDQPLLPAHLQETQGAREEPVGPRQVVTSWRAHRRVISGQHQQQHLRLQASNSVNEDTISELHKLKSNQKMPTPATCMENIGCANTQRRVEEKRVADQIVATMVNQSSTASARHRRESTTQVMGPCVFTAVTCVAAPAVTLSKAARQES